MVMEISAFVPATVTTHDEELLLVFASGVVEMTVAVFVSGPGVFGAVTATTIVAEAPLAIAPREQVTELVKEQDPCVGVADTNVAPGGRISVTVTAAAEMGPAFATAKL